ncbi:uncharacterized protein GLRG_04656 [Colletotrichum graminicola M1.001]|uniref:Major facilitator superfamily (MFS) profile domain-containing protein n=1 Tax=Colletotrichum graminicola (strain M1.001 / M2 / FGSC 10212) TaxID=645133 RepID=E3QF74_COLGM|nr:uncharacterized protein GLRG_04656 [Colletotrichum graminicola M1.001]EFQ29512.1 hypothetical protein GLRG_04656 [Colletotrichum graminicola M1.001]
MPMPEVLAGEFGVSNAQINLSVTTYVVFQGVTPMFIGGLADKSGRLPAYILCLAVFTAANIGLAHATSYARLLAVRCVQSAGVEATMVLCQAIVADIITSAERGHYVGIAAIPAILGTKSTGSHVRDCCRPPAFAGFRVR